MTFARRLRLDFHPSAFALIASWGMLDFCAVASSGSYPWSVDSAYKVALTISLFWWIWSDAVRRGFPLMPAWGLWITLAASIVVIVYLFASRRWWGFVTILLYAAAFLLMSVLSRLFV